MFALFYLRLLGVCVGRSGRDFARGCAMRFEPGFVKEASRVRHAFLWLGPFSWPKGECGASLAGPFWAYFSENLTNFAERGVILEQVGNEGQFALTKNADSFYLWSYGPIFGGQHGESLGCFFACSRWRIRLKPVPLCARGLGESNGTPCTCVRPANTELCAHLSPPLFVPQPPFTAAKWQRGGEGVLVWPFGGQKMRVGGVSEGSCGEWGREQGSWWGVQSPREVGRRR